MRTLIAPITGGRRAGRAGCSGRRAWGLAVPLLVTGALAAGCGSASSTGNQGAAGPAAAGGAGGGAGGGAVHSTATATPIASAAPVPTVSGGPAPVGGVACSGWPPGAASTALPASFVPVSAERCVNGVTSVPGKGPWTTATLQRSTSDLSGLVSALRQPSATRKPGTVCPALAMIPPQVLLVNAAGEKLMPRLPLGDCGLTASAVLTALGDLSWQPVSVRLIAPVPGATGAAPTVSGTAPHAAAPTSGGHVQPQ